LIFLRLGPAGRRRGSWISALVIAAGIVVILSGLAVLAIVATVLAVIGGAVLAVRSLTGAARPGSRPRRGVDDLEVEPDFEILPATRANEDLAAHPRVSTPEANER
jgi:hypothetical protein